MVDEGKTTYQGTANDKWVVDHLDFEPKSIHMMTQDETKDALTRSLMEMAQLRTQLKRKEQTDLNSEIEIHYWKDKYYKAFNKVADLEIRAEHQSRAVRKQRFEAYEEQQEKKKEL